MTRVFHFILVLVPMFSFLTFFTVVQPSAKHMTSAYYVPSETVSLAGSIRSMQLIDELFVFCRLHAVLLEQG